MLLKAKWGLSVWKSLGLHPRRVRLTRLLRGPHRRDRGLYQCHTEVSYSRAKAGNTCSRLTSDTRQSLAARGRPAGPLSKPHRQAQGPRGAGPAWTREPRPLTAAQHQQMAGCPWVRSNSVGRALCGAGWQGKQRLKPRPREAPWHPAQGTAAHSLRNARPVVP